MKSCCLLLICILSGITATDVPISCVKCVGEDVKTCQGTAEKCLSATDECISVLEVTKIGTRETSVFMRLCGNCSHHKTGTVRFDKGILKINATCCNTDNCTPVVPTIPPDKPVSKDEKVKFNGLRCKSCYASIGRYCDCNTFVNCTAGETKCISRFLSATGYSHFNLMRTPPCVHSGGYTHLAAMRGCTTPDMCEVTPKEIKLNSTQLKTNLSCTDESDSVHNSLLLLVLTAALFSKFTTTT